jgi:hypothetical protein
VRKTLSTVADSRAPLGRRIAGMLMVLALVSMLTGFGVCVAGKMFGIVLFLSGPIIAVAAFVVSTVTDVGVIRREYATDVERIEALRGDVERDDAVPVETILDEHGWAFQDLRRPLAYLVWHDQVVVARDADGRSTIARRAAPVPAAGEGVSSAVKPEGVDMDLHAEGESLILPSIEGALVADERYRRRMAAKAGQALGLLVMLLGVSNLLAVLGGGRIPFAFEAGLLLFGVGFILSSREQTLRSRVLRQLRDERDRIVYELLRGRRTMTVGEIREETGWTRQELDDVLMRLGRKRLLHMEGGLDDADVVSTGSGRAK